MNDLFASGHRQLFDTQCSGLSAAWRRAAEEAARQPVRAPRRGAGITLRSAIRAGLATVAGAMLFAAAWSSLAGAGAAPVGAGAATVARAAPAGAVSRLHG